MKTLLSLIAITVLSNVLIAGNAHRGTHSFQSRDFDKVEQLKCDANITSTLPLYELSYEQQEDIEFMYQEEKMARDVYLTFYEKYGLSLFKNIATSEQKHMDAVKSLLDKYSLDVAIDEENIGDYVDPDLQALYAQLTEQGMETLEEALKVGQTIENVDIDDLIATIETANEDAKIVFEQLKFASYKHLDAFTKTLNADNEVGTKNSKRGSRKSKGFSR